VSGKDLIQNHLTFSLYNHVAMWGEDKTKLPLSFRWAGAERGGGAPLAVQPGPGAEAEVGALDVGGAHARKKTAARTGASTAANKPACQACSMAGT
jgi:hypothetical protein